MINEPTRQQIGRGLSMKIEFADQFQISAFEEIAIVFFQEILDMDYLAMLVTDESALSDFVDCGEYCSDFPEELTSLSIPRKERYELWTEWVCRKISHRYGIELPDARIYLVDLFRRIKVFKKEMIQ